MCEAKEVGCEPKEGAHMGVTSSKMLIIVFVVFLYNSRNHKKIELSLRCFMNLRLGW